MICPRRCRRPGAGSVSASTTVGKDRDTYIDTNPDGEYRVVAIPLREAGGLRTLQVQVDLINEREHGRHERRHEVCIGRCATAREVVRVHGAGVELRGVVADPVRASRSGVAWEGRIAEWVGRRCKAESRVEAALRVAVAAI